MKVRKGHTVKMKIKMENSKMKGKIRTEDQISLKNRIKVKSKEDKAEDKCTSWEKIIVKIYKTIV